MPASKASSEEEARQNTHLLAKHLLLAGPYQVVIDLGGRDVQLLRQYVRNDRIVVFAGRERQQEMARANPSIRCFPMRSDLLERLSDDFLSQSLVICSDLPSLGACAQDVRKLLQRMQKVCPYVLLPSSQKWQPAQETVAAYSTSFAKRLASIGIHAEIYGMQGSSEKDKQVEQDHFALGIAGSHALVGEAPAKTVLSLLSTYNDADFIKICIEHLLKEGVSVCVIDNWSSDGTWEIVQHLAAQFPQGIVHLEQFPPEGRSPHFEWKKIVERKVELSGQLHFDWYMQHDSDELRYSPAAGMNTAEAISRVDACGFNAIDYTQVEFRPVDDDFAECKSLQSSLQNFEYGIEAGSFSNIRTWKNQGEKIDLVSSGGHFARFPGRRVFPLKFLMCHFPFRTAAQTKRKLCVDRLNRIGKESKQFGWHTHIRPMADRLAQTNWLWNESLLMSTRMEDLTYGQLLPRLRGVLFAHDFHLP